MVYFRRMSAFALTKCNKYVLLCVFTYYIYRNFFVCNRDNKGICVSCQKLWKKKKTMKNFVFCIQYEVWVGNLWIWLLKITDENIESIIYSQMRTYGIFDVRIFNIYTAASAMLTARHTLTLIF